MTSLHPHHNAPINWRAQCALGTEWTAVLGALAAVPASSLRRINPSISGSCNLPTLTQLIPSLLLSTGRRRSPDSVSAERWPLTAWPSVRHRPLRQHRPIPTPSTASNGRPPPCPSPAEPRWRIGLISAVSAAASTASVSNTGNQQHRVNSSDRRPMQIGS